MKKLINRKFNQNQTTMSNQKVSYRERLKAMIKYYNEIITALKECNQVEFSKEYDVGVSFGNDDLTDILKEGAIAYFQEAKDKARSELVRLN